MKLAPSVQNSLNPKINKVDGTKSLLRIKATDKENKLHEIQPEFIKNVNGIHHISSNDQYTVFDTKEY